MVGDPRRLPEWTGAGPPVWGEAPPGAPGAEAAAGWVAGATFSLPQPGLGEWSVISTGQRVVEAAGRTPCGRTGIGVRVIALRGAQRDAEHDSCRVVFVARLEPAGSSLRARVIDVPSLRRRFDRWAARLRLLAR